MSQDDRTTPPPGGAELDEKGRAARAAGAARDALRWTAALVGRVVWQTVRSVGLYAAVGLALGLVYGYLLARHGVSYGAPLLGLAGLLCFGALGAVRGPRLALGASAEKLVGQLAGQVQRGVLGQREPGTGRTSISFRSLEREVGRAVKGIQGDGKGNFLTRRVRALTGLAADHAGKAMLSSAHGAAKPDGKGGLEVNLAEVAGTAALARAREAADDAVGAAFRVPLFLVLAVTVVLFGLPLAGIWIF